MRRAGQFDGQAANAFESSCRAILVDAGIAGFQAQVNIRHKGRWIGRVDLVHMVLHIVIECDGFETHGTLDAMTRDCIRHTRLVAAGWRPLRFTWYQVMHRPDWVLEQVTDTIAAVQRTSATTKRRVAG
jgi:very-short-patch-repair endonuclease